MSKDKLSDFRPQAKNANKHTSRGISMLDKSMSEDGYVAPMTATADGEIIDGSARLERVAERFSGVDPIIIEHDGKRPIIAVRTDIANANTPEAKRIALRANRIAEADLEWDAEIVKELGEEIDLSDMFSEKELNDLGLNIEGDVSFSLPDGDKAPFQQMTFTLADEQANVIKNAIADIKKTDLYKYAETMGNENSNGNALYLIVSEWVRQKK